jgi:mannose-1-phosphate guanylyltransferase
MNAVVLVGGGGTRLRPLTYAVPKPLLPVLNRPLITHLLANLQRHGVNHVVFAAAAGDHRIEEVLGSGEGTGLTLTYSYEVEPLGSGLAVKQAARDFESAFFVCNGDVISDLDLTAMAQRHRERDAILSISLASVENPTGYGVVELAEGDRIIRFVEKPPPGEAPSSWANAGTWLFEPAVLNHIPDEKMDRSLEQLVFPALIADGWRVQGFPSGGYWMDVGTCERYLQLHYDLLNGVLPGCLTEDTSSAPAISEGSEVWPDAAIGARVILGSGCRVGAQVQVTGPSVIGDRCDLREKAIVERCVIWSNAKIGAGAIVRDSVIGEGCLIGDEAIVEGAVLANGARVKRGVRLPPAARLEPYEVAG